MEAVAEDLDERELMTLSIQCKARSIDEFDSTSWRESATDSKLPGRPCPLLYPRPAPAAAAAAAAAAARSLSRRHRSSSEETEVSRAVYAVTEVSLSRRCRSSSEETVPPRHEVPGYARPRVAGLVALAAAEEALESPLVLRDAFSSVDEIAAPRRQSLNHEP